MSKEKLETSKKHFDKRGVNLELLKAWISNKKVLDILKTHNINLNIFIKEYALNIVKYHLDVINNPKIKIDDKNLKSCVIFFKDNDISLDELFIIFNRLKSSLIEYIPSIENSDLNLIKDINYIYEESFLKILEIYSKSLSKIKKRLVKKNDIVDKYVIMSKVDKEGNIIDVSQAFCDISGYTKEELIGKKYLLLKHPSFPNEKMNEIWETVNSGKIWQGEIKNQKKDGTVYWVEATISPVFNENKEILYFDSVRQDISSKKEFEEQQAILIEQSKSAAMGEMISMIAHQWRQPLQAVSLLVQKLPLSKLKDGYIDDELLAQVEKDITSQLEYMSSTIDNFRDFFLPNKPKEKILVKELISRSIDFISFLLKNNSIQIEVNTKDDVLLSCYVNELIQVLINIIKNAVDILIERDVKKERY
jgi:PAS domain S-box-containing protein